MDQLEQSNQIWNLAMTLVIAVSCLLAATALVMARRKKRQRLIGLSPEGKAKASRRTKANRWTMADSLFSRWKRKISRDSKEVYRFIDSAELGKVEVVKKMIDGAINVNAKRHRGGRSALMKASANNHYKVVALLVENGASVDAKGGKSKKTALMRASENNCRETLKILLAHGASPDMRNELSGKTALMLACENSHVDAVDILMQFGADPNVKDHRGRTPLMLAVMRDHRRGMEVIQTLVAHGARVNEQDHSGKHPLDLAFEAGIKEYVQLLEANGGSFGVYAGESQEFFDQSALDRAYATLQCQRSDADERITAQYHALAKTYHPDIIQGKELPSEFIELAGKKFQEIQESYQTINRYRKQERSGSHGQ